MTTKFYYQGRDINGSIVTGEIESNKVEEVVTHLKQHNIIPLSIKPIQKKFFSIPFDTLPFITKFHKIEAYHIMNFCRQLATLNSAGLSMIRSINKLSQSASSRHLGAILNTVSNDISAGMTLADALKRHPEVFPPIIVNIVDIGENTGHLSESLLYLASYVEATIANRRRLVSAVRYPVFVLISITVAMVVMNYLVIPKFSSMFTRYGLELPLATRIIIGSSNFMVKYKFLIIIAAIGAFFGIRMLFKIPTIRYFWDKYKLRFPVFGDLQKRIALSQFTWTFSLILRAGVPIIKGITLASNSTENIYFSRRLLTLRTAIEHGESLSNAAIASGLFTPMTIQMIEVGEESEKLDEVLSEIAKYYDAEIDYDLKRLNELIEPLLLIIIGGMVLILALGIYFPMWDLIKIAKV